MSTKVTIEAGPRVDIMRPAVVLVFSSRCDFLQRFMWASIHADGNALALGLSKDAERCAVPPEATTEQRTDAVVELAEACEWLMQREEHDSDREAAERLRQIEEDLVVRGFGAQHNLYHRSVHRWMSRGHRRVHPKGGGRRREMEPWEL